MFHLSNKHLNGKENVVTILREIKKNSTKCYVKMICNKVIIWIPVFISAHKSIRRPVLRLPLSGRLYIKIIKFRNREIKRSSALNRLGLY